MNSPSLNMDRFNEATTDAPHELSEAVNLIKKAGHPAFELERLLKRMASTRDWIKRNRAETMNCGAWLTNRLKEQAAGPQPRN